MKLSDERCTVPHPDEHAVAMDKARDLVREVPRWVLGPSSLEREFRFKDFRGAMAFVNRVADVAERENHHPDIHISWNKVRMTLSTHKIGGLSRNDFIMAAKIDLLAEG